MPSPDANSFYRVNSTTPHSSHRLKKIDIAKESLFPDTKMSKTPSEDAITAEEIAGTAPTASPSRNACISHSNRPNPPFF